MFRSGRLVEDRTGLEGNGLAGVEWTGEDGNGEDRKGAAGTDGRGQGTMGLERHGRTG